MPKEQKDQDRLTLDRLRTGAVFKVVEDGEGFTVSGVYQIGTARSDHGKNVVITDLAGMRIRRVEGNVSYSFDHRLAVTVTRARAKEIEVYLVRSR